MAFDDLPFPRGSSVVAYLRASPGREQDLSVSQQKEHAYSWCEENGLILTKVFSDDARSGSTVAGRSSFEKMIRYLRNGGAGEKGILLWRWSRFARDIDDAQYYRADLRRRGYEFYSLKDNIPTGPEARLFEGILDWHNQRYLEELREDIKRGLHYVVQTYKAFLGRPPAGYLLEKVQVGTRRDGSPHHISRLVVDPDKGPRVTEAFRMRAQGATLSEIAKATQVFSTIPPFGKLFRKRIYLGIFDWGGITIENFCEPLTDLETWTKVQEVNTARHERFTYNHPRRVHSQYALTGLARCARCGKPMVGRPHGSNTHYPSGSKIYTYYRCNSQTDDVHPCGARLIRQDDLEKLVIERLMEQVLSPEVLRHYYALAKERVNKGDNKQQAMIQRLRSDLAGIEQKISRLVAAIAAMGHSQALLSELQTLETKQAEIRAQIATLEIQNTKKTLPDLTPDDLKRLGNELTQKLLSDDPVEKAKVLRDLIIEVRAENVGERRKHQISGAILYRPPFGGEPELIDL